LLDQNYASDPECFYFPMKGKIKPTSNKLKPENVCYDVTNGIQADDSDFLPIVFATGFKIDYIPGGKAHPLANANPDGVPVSFKSNSAAWVRSTSNGITLIDPAFDPKGRTYQQLTPDGPLP
jgi:hypothetical protein